MEQSEPPKKKMGRPFGNTPAQRRENKERLAQGLPPLVPESRKYKTKAIVPASKKAKYQEVLAEMLNKKGKMVVKKILEKALDDDSPHQMEAMKIVVDRILPKDYMEKARQRSGNVTIQIMGVNGETTITASSDEPDFVDADFEELDDND